MSDFETLFRQKGLCVTVSRRAVFNVVEKAVSHMTVTAIWENARQYDRRLGLTTVYRTLNTLCSLGLIEKHEFPNLETVYEKSITGKRHYHIIDLDSGTVEEFTAEELNILLKKIAERRGYKVLGHKIEIYVKKL